MEKPDLFEFEGDDRALSWLASMQPASAAALKPDFLYRAGFEAAQAQLQIKLRRWVAIGSAALLLVALGAGTLVFELGSRHGQVLATRHLHADDGGPAREQHAAIIREAVEDEATAEETTQSATADQPARRAATEADQTFAGSALDQAPAISQWWQSQLRQYFDGTAAQRALAHPRLELGRAGAGWEDTVESMLEARRTVSLVTKSSATKSPGRRPTVKEAPPVSPSVRLRGSLLPLRDRQLQTLMNELL